MSAQENITSKSAHVYLESLQGTIFDFFFLGGFVLIDPIREKKWEKNKNEERQMVNSRVYHTS